MAGEFLTENSVPIQSSGPTSDKDPFYWTEMVDPEGNRKRAAPHNLDALLKEGYKLFNENRDVDVSKGFLVEPKKISAADLPDYVKQGYSYSATKADEWNAHQKYLQELATKQPEIQLSGLEKTLGLVNAAASSATFGLSDVLSRGIFELEGAITGDSDYGRQAAENLRFIRDNLGTAGTVAEVLGAIAMPGAIAGKLGTSLGKMALSGALEGALSGVGYSASRAALDDPTATAGSLLFNTGLGAVAGGALGGVFGAGGALSRLVGKKAEKVDISGIDVELPKVADIFNSNDPITKTVDIFHKNQLVGHATLAKNVDGYHKGSRYGAALEKLEIFDTAKGLPKGFETAVVKNLTDVFGSITSPTKLVSQGGDEFTHNLLGKWGTTHKAKNGDTWFEITRDDMPSYIGGDKNVSATIKEKILDLMGKKPDAAEDPIGAQVWERAFNPDNGLFREDFINFLQDRTGYLAKAGKAFEAFDDLTKQSVAASKAIREQFVDGLTDKGFEVMKTKTASLLSDIEKKLNYLSTRKGDQYRKLENELINLRDNLTLSTDRSLDKVEAWKKAFSAREDFKANFESMDKQFKTPEMKAIHREMYGKIKDVIADAGVIGKYADDFARLDNLATQNIENSTRFNKAFKKNGRIDVEKLDNNWKSRSAGKELSQNTLIDDLRLTSLNFMKEVKDLQAKGLASNISVPDPDEYVRNLKLMNNIRDFYLTSKVLNSAKAGTTASSFTTSVGASLGSLTGYSLGSLAGPLPGVLLSILGSNFSTRVIEKATDPMSLMKVIQASDKSTSFLAKLARRTVAASDKTAKTLSPRAIRTVVQRTLGINNKASNEEYYNKVRKRVAELGSPDMLLNNVEGLGPEITTQLALNSKRMSDYVLKQLPVVKPNQSVSMADSLKADKLLLAIAKPTTALKQAALTGDGEWLKHIGALHPNVVDRFQEMYAKELEGIDVMKIPYQKRLKMESLLNLNQSGTSQGAARLAQGVFAAKKEEKLQPQAQEQTVGEMLAQP